MTSIKVMPRAPANRSRLQCPPAGSRPPSGEAPGALEPPPVLRRRPASVAEGARVDHAREEPGARGVGDVLGERELAVGRAFLPLHGDRDPADGRLEHRLERRIHDREHHREQPLRARAPEALLHRLPDALSPPSRSRPAPPAGFRRMVPIVLGIEVGSPLVSDASPASRPRPPPRSDESPPSPPSAVASGSLTRSTCQSQRDIRRPPCRRSRSCSCPSPRSPGIRA